MLRCSPFHMSDTTTSSDRIAAVLKRVPTFSNDKTAFVSWEDELRVAVCMVDRTMFSIQNGQARPTNEVAGRKWDRKNSDLFALLFLTTSEPATATIGRLLFVEGEDHDDPRVVDAQAA